MEPERAKELCEYLKTKMQLSFSLYQKVEEEPDFAEKLYHELEERNEDLCRVLNGAFRDANNLKPIEKELSINLAAIPDGKSYTEKLQNLIEWTAGDGCLLELIAAAYKLKPKNPSLRRFVEIDLKKIIEKVNPSVTLTTQLQSVPTYLTSSEKNNDGTLNAYNQAVDGNSGINGNGTKRIKVSRGNSKEGTKIRLPIPFLPQLVPEEVRSSEKSIALAYELIYTARDTIQSACDTFQNDEQFSENEVVNQVNVAKEDVKKISGIVEHIPVPDYPDLHYRLVGEQEYFCELASIVSLSLQKIRNQMPAPLFIQSIEEKLDKLLPILQQMENLIGEFVRQVKQLNQTDDSASRNSS